MIKSVNFPIQKLLILILICISGYSKILAQNAIQIENQNPGTPASVWDINGSGDLSIQGFATDISYNKGETAHFKIKTDASNYTINVYRLGYYQGNGARLMGSAVITPALPQNQPPCITDPATGLLDCGNWAESAHWDIPASAVSGLYIAKLTRTDNSNKSSHIAFVVRDDASHSDLLFQTSDATWQAYNVYGDNNNGRSLYTGAGGKASKVSYNRPFYTRTGGGGGGPEEDWLFNSEYPMIRFLEKNGFDMTYSTNIDSDRNGALIKNHKVFMSVGHDEYWSQGMRDNVANARNSGVHLAFFSGNEVYWRTRWENSVDGANKSYRTLVCYKEGTLGENQCNGKCDPAPNEWTGLWRSGCEHPGTNGCNPENALSGQISWDGTTGTMEVPSTYKNLRFWRNTDVATLTDGQTATLTENTLGYEWNPEQETYRSSYPAGRILLSSTEVNGKMHHLSMYKHSSGALVFGAGTVQWAWGLDDQHDRGNQPVSPAMQQATINLFADMGVQPASLQSGLLPASASTDVQAPSLIITSPGNGATIPGGAAFSITGTASDNMLVAGVEVSTDGGTTWRLANGTTNWNFAWAPASPGAAIILSRAFDDSGNISANSSVNVTVTAPACPCTVFLPTDVPVLERNNDGNQAIQLGMKFRSDVDGFVTGVRFYKHNENTGTHTGQLYSKEGALLAQIIFSNETASGWQQALFSTPVAITAGVTYVISYHSSTGFYSATNPFFDVAKVNGHLRALANGEDGNNGIYQYSSNPTFPTSNYETSNYYVDVVFETTSQPDVTPPAVASTSPVNNAAAINVSTNITVTFNEAIDPATISGSTVRLLHAGTPVAATVTYNASALTATIDPDVNLNYATNYTIEILGGGSDPRVKDMAGNALASNYTWSFTTQNTPPPPLPSPNEGPGGPILVISSTANPFSRFAVEILRAEGLNEFAAKDISDISADPNLLNGYDVIVLGEISLSAGNVTSLTNWVNAGGTLIAFKPDLQLSPLLGITRASNSLADKYLKVNTASGPGIGIIDETIQFHGVADLYTLNGATSLAMLYSDANTATANPAVTTHNVGANGGKAIAFTYDLSKSIVYTRQGNPAYAENKRDGQEGPIRSDDMFYPDWVDLNKVAIPQADEQQRLLVNIILQSNMHRKPLPRFWYLPRNLKAAVIMTGDDHGNGGTIGRFDDYSSKSSSNEQAAVDNWTAIRGTSYIFPGTPITNAQIIDYQSKGFEIALHLNTGCGNFDITSLRGYVNDQLPALSSQFPGLSSPTTNRTHCIAWSDWASVPKVELENGIRLDANYYYWPGAWLMDRPGMFTGSGIPMRFADLDGSLIDVYQAATQLTDESGITYTTHINTLLDNALGSKGYYGVFTANMHTDQNGGNSSNGSDVIVAAAQQRNVPVISAKQMLTWLDGRNNSSFGAMSWNNNTLNFSITTASGSNNLRGMLPVNSAGGQLSALTVNGGSVAYTTETIKGISYAFFPANNGTYAATYTPALVDNVPPQITAVTVSPPTAGSVTITWTTNEAADSQVEYGTSSEQLYFNVADPNLVTSHSITLGGLTAGTTYYFKVISTDAASNSAAEPATGTLSFTIPAPVTACFTDITSDNFNAGNAGTGTYVTSEGVILKPAIVEEFTSLPAESDWRTLVWNNGGSATINNGQLIVNGARYATEPEGKTSGPGTSIEFVATFGAAANQHIGFGAGNYAEMFNSVATWAMFSTGGSGNTLMARVSNNGSNTDVPLSPALLGSSHRYRIDWNADNFKFYVDGNLLQTIPGVITTPMRFGISDYIADAPAVILDWARISPYAGTGSFTSRIYDAGSSKTWQQVNWTATTAPDNTNGVRLYQRQGNSADPGDNSWSSFVEVTNGAMAGGTSRYIQYRADLSTNNPAVTPILKSVSINCAEPACPTLVFTPATGTVLTNATVGTSYSQTISTSTTGYTFSATGLPDGLSIDPASGTISGTPTLAVANISITITATQGSCSGNASYTLTVNGATTCSAGSNQVTLNDVPQTNNCPAATINLNNLVTGTTPAGSELVFYTTSNHAAGTKVADPTKATVPGTYYAFYYDATNSCYNTENSTAIVSATMVSCPDLRPYFTMDNVEFTSAVTSNPFVLRIRNTRAGSNAADPISVLIYKPTSASTITLTGQAASEWTQVSMNANYYEFSTNVDMPYSASGGYSITANLTIPSSPSKGAYNFRSFIKSGAGGEPAADSENNNIVVGVSKQ